MSRIASFSQQLVYRMAQGSARAHTRQLVDSFRIVSSCARRQTNRESANQWPDEARGLQMLFSLNFNGPEGRDQEREMETERKKKDACSDVRTAAPMHTDLAGSLQPQDPKIARSFWKL